MPLDPSGVTAPLYSTLIIGGESLPHNRLRMPFIRISLSMTRRSTFFFMEPDFVGGCRSARYRNTRKRGVISWTWPPAGWTSARRALSGLRRS